MKVEVPCTLVLEFNEKDKVELDDLKSVARGVFMPSGAGYTAQYSIRYSMRIADTAIEAIRLREE